MCHANLPNFNAMKLHYASFYKITAQAKGLVEFTEQSFSRLCLEIEVAHYRT